MNQNIFKLSEKSVILAGPLSRIIQSMATLLTELGADVALLTDKEKEATRFADNLSEQKEVNEKFGRAMAIEVDFTEPQQARDAVSRVAETLGGVDALVDGQFLQQNSNFNTGETVDKLSQYFESNLKSTMLMTYGALQFLEGRKKGRVVYLIDETACMGIPGESLNSLCRSNLSYFVKTLSKEVSEKNITVNCLSVGVTEDYLMQKFPKAGSINGAKEEFMKLVPHTKITDPSEIASVVAFLVSSMSSAITGQTIKVDNGLSLM